MTNSKTFRTQVTKSWESLWVSLRCSVRFRTRYRNSGLATSIGFILRFLGYRCNWCAAWEYFRNDQRMSFAIVFICYKVKFCTRYDYSQRFLYFHFVARCSSSKVPLVSLDLCHLELSVIMKLIDRVFHFGLFAVFFQKFLN